MGVVIEPYFHFELEWARFFRTKEAVACSSGTAALHLALVALGVGKGDEVIVPEFTMVACANAVKYTGAKPVFVDCGDDLNIDPELIGKAITPKTKAIMVVHIYGNPCDMDRILDIAGDIPVIEDAAEAIGALYKGVAVGTLGTIGCFSHYKNKIIACEEGGSILTHSRVLAKKMRSLRCHAFDEDHTFLHTTVGFNYRMTNTQALMLLTQKWDKLIAERRLSNGAVKWVHPVIYDSEEERDLAYSKAQAAGQNPRLFFKPMSMQPMYRGSYKKLKAYDFSKRGMYLPFKP